MVRNTNKTMTVQRSFSIVTMAPNVGHESRLSMKIKGRLPQPVNVISYCVIPWQAKETPDGLLKYWPGFKDYKERVYYIKLLIQDIHVVIIWSYLPWIDWKLYIFTWG